MCTRAGIRLAALLLAATCGIATLAHADTGDGCGAATRAIVAQLKPVAPPARKIDVSRMVCKAWPGKADTLLAAVPLMQQLDADDNTGDLEMLVLDRHTSRVRQRLLLPNLMSDGAVRIDRLTLDTARYQLAPATRAFALRIHRTGSSRVNPFSEMELQLFVVRDNQLVRVLDGLVTAQDGGEWDGECAGDFSSTSRTLSMDGQAHHGYHDITVNSRKEASSSTLDKQGNCVDGPRAVSSQQARLRFDGTRYEVPAPLKPLDDD
ncbi:MAG TPA: hypothetical protein VN043_04140 [Rhodanobacter sp.]|nr:hypothetical protein [Rhodanobacter sp.]